MAALVTGIVGLVPVAVVLGVLGIRRTADGTRAGRGLAVAGLVLAGVWTGLAVLAVAVLAFLVTGLAVGASCVGERCDVTVRGEQLTEVSDHDLAVTDIGAGRATVTVDGDPMQLRVGETRQVGRSLVQLTSVEGEDVELTIDFGGEYLPRDEVESRVAVEFAVDRQQVTCPRDLAAVEGNAMTCDVTAGPGTWSEARVTVTAVEGEQVDTTVEGSRAPVAP